MSNMKQITGEHTRVLIIDIGTSSIRVSIVDEQMAVLDSETLKRKAEITFDAGQQWTQIKDMIIRLVVRNQKISGICVSSLVGWVGVERSSEPITPCFTYMHRCEKQYQAFAEKYTDQDVYPINGRCMNPELGIFKLKYLKEECPEQYQKIYCFLSNKDFINLKLTGKFAMDRTSACYTMAYDIHQTDWSRELIDKVGVDQGKLPQLIWPYECLGTVKQEIAQELGIPEKTPVVCGGPDGSVGILGAGGITENMAVSVMGTTDVAFAISKECKLDETRSLVVNPHVISGLWLIGGPMGMYGGTVDWLIHNVMYDCCDIQTMNDLAGKIPAGSDGLKFIPTLLGERTPFWNANIQGTMVGLRPFHKAEHIYRAIMEANGYTLKKILELTKQSGIKVDQVVSIGGGSNSKQWLQIRSDIIQLPVISVEVAEATTIGSAMLLFLMKRVPTEQLPSPAITGSYLSDATKASAYEDFYNAYLQLMLIADKIYT